MKALPVHALLALMLFVVGSALSGFMLEHGSGSVIKGDLISFDRQQAIVKAEFGSITFRRDQLNQTTIQRLDLLSGDPQQKLAARTLELDC
jgi:hypothetical protein